MPASTYSEYKDPRTGEIIWLPQLFPFASTIGEILPTEMENWIKTGVIPNEVYETHLKETQKAEDRKNRLMNGEEIPASEITSSNPCVLDEYQLKNKGRIYGENVLIKMFSGLDDNDPDIIWLSFIYEALTSIATENPLPIHQYIAGKVLKERYEIDDSRALDILARDLVEHCRHILQTFNSFKHPAFNKNPIDPSYLFDHLESKKKHILQIDEDFIRYMKRLGSKGKKLAVDIEKKSKELFDSYKNSNYSAEHRRSVWSLWVNPNERKEKESIFLSALSMCLWEDQCGKLWKRETSGHPSLSKNIIERMIPILSPKKKKEITEKDGEIIFSHNGNPILSAPAIDPVMINAFKNGFKDMSSLTGHKLLRWQVNTGFEQWATGNSDPRSIEIEGGYSKIAELIKSCNPREIAKIREILQVQAHGHFIFSDGSRGNMIQLRINGFHRNKEPSKINIVLGDMLLPTYVCKLPKSDKLLIPIGDLPPLYGSANSHANQAQLQLLVFQEFSKQSVRLAKEGSVLITAEQWEQLAQEAEIPPDRIRLIIEYWCQPDLFKCFLEKQGEEYRLAQPYSRAQKFLEDQGNKRIANSTRGKRSAEKRGKKS